MNSDEAPRAHNSMSTTILEPTHDHEAELLLEASRARRVRRSTAAR